MVKFSRKELACAAQVLLDFKCENHDDSVGKLSDADVMREALTVADYIANDYGVTLVPTYDAEGSVVFDATTFEL